METFMSEDSFDILLAEKRLSEMVQKGILDARLLIHDEIEYKFSKIFSERFERNKRMLVGRSESYENRISDALSLSIMDISSRNKKNSDSLGYGLALSAVMNGFVPNRSIRLWAEEAQALKTCEREVYESPTDKELENNMLKFSNEQSIYKVFSEKYKDKSEGADKIRTCKNNFRCVFLGDEIFSHPYLSEKFLVNNVCGPCEYYKEEKTDLFSEMKK